MATGSYRQQELAWRASGSEIAEKVGEVWGFGEDGELSNMFRRTPHLCSWVPWLVRCRTAVTIQSTLRARPGPMRLEISGH